jgi:hypothetical protein
MAKLPQFPITGFATVLGSSLNNMVNVLNNLTGNGTAGAVTATTLSATGTSTLAAVNASGLVTLSGGAKISGLQTDVPQLVTAAGATQGNATAITSSLAIINVATTASTHGVKLPTASTGLVVTVGNLGAFGTKVYPATGDKIGAASTNAADSTVLAINKANTYIALNTTLWTVQRGA